MKQMIVPTDDWILYKTVSGGCYHCKRCHMKFKIETPNKYLKKVCFCPFCGQETEKHKQKAREEDELLCVQDYIRRNR